MCREEMDKIRVGQEVLIVDRETGCFISKPVLWTGTRNDFFITGEDFYEKYNQEKVEQRFGVKFPCFRQDLKDDTLWNILYGKGVRLVHQEFIPEYFEVRDYRYWIQENKPFIFPIRIEFDTALRYFSKIKLPKDLKEAVQAGLATIVIESPWETRNLAPWCFEGLVNFQKIYRFPKNQVIFCGSQAGSKVETLVTTQNYPFTFHKIQYFREFCWNVNRQSILRPEVQSKLNNWFKFFSGETGKRGFSKTFLAELGRSTPDRLFLFGILHEEFKDKSYFSFRNHYDSDTAVIYGNLQVLKEIMFRYVDWYGKIADFLKSYDYSKRYELDLGYGSQIEDWFSLDSDKDFRKSSFVEIVPETNFTNEYNSFITEKTYKPILSAKPFIVVANSGFLKALQEDGFQTFSRWWDESYDEEKDGYLRLIKIRNLLQSLSKLSEEEMQKMYEEMKPTLLHNFNLLVDRGETIKTLRWYRSLEKLGTKTKVSLI